MTRFFRLTDKQQEGIRLLQSARVPDEVTLSAARHELSRMPRSSTNRTEIVAKSRALTDQLETMLTTFESNCKVLLTPEQAAKWPGFDTYVNILFSFKDCRFTPEQDAKIQELCVESSKQKETVPPGGIPPLRRLEQEIREKVQTEKQREESISLKVNQDATRRFRMADLTTEQETMIQKMVNDMLPQFVAARSDPKAYFKLRTQLFDEIRAQVLTQEQRARTAPVKGTSAPFPAPPPTTSKTDAPPSSKPEAAATPATEHTTPTKP